MELIEVPVDNLVLSDDNVRTVVSKPGLTELAQSIAHSGIQVPIKVTPLGDGKYQVVAGERRTLAVRLINEKPEKFGTTIIAAMPATVDIQSDTERIVTMLVENLQREDLSPLDEARGYLRLVDEVGWQQKDIATRVGRSKAHVSKRLTLLTLPRKAQDLVGKGKLTIEDALELAKLAEHPDAIEDLIANSYQDEDGIELQTWRIDDQLRKIQRASEIAAAKAEVLRRYSDATLTFNVADLPAPDGKVLAYVGESTAKEWNGTLPEDDARVVELQQQGGTLYLVFYAWEEPQNVDAKTAPSSTSSSSSTTSGPTPAQQLENRVSNRLTKAKAEHERTFLRGLAKRPKATTVKALTRRIVRGELYRHAQELCTILELEPKINEVKYSAYNSTEADAKVRKEKDWLTPINTYFDASDANADRVAVVLGMIQCRGYDPGELGDKIRQEAGYEPFDAVQVEAQIRAQLVKS